MTDLTRLTAAETAARIASGEVTAVEVTEAHLARIEAVDEKVHAFLHVDREGALAQARAVDEKRERGEELGPLAGVPLALKDIFTTKGMPTTVGSKILEGWIPPYDATLTQRLREADVVVLGKTNMDEFAMGSSTENSAFGPTGNPWDLTRIPGGSGGGSSAALASFQAPLAIGTDTGGSIRQPAAVTGTVGVKPTYGAVSRYGMVAFSSSLDQGGPCARTVLDAALLHEAIAGHDPLDSTSIDQPVPAVVEAARNGDVRGMRVGVVKEFAGEGYQAGVMQRFNESVELLRELGAEIVELSCPSFDKALAAYYLIAPSECSSNLARFDAMRYGLRVGDDGTRSAEDVTALTRAEGFGPEVKRRIMLGTYALSSGYYDAYYGSAQKVRTLIKRDFDKAFEQVDVVVSPTTPTTAFPIGERADDPMAMYLADLCTIPSNLAGNAAMSLPCGLAPEDGLPVGLQIVAPAMADDRLYRVGAAVEAALTAKWGHPLLEEAPSL
ncbi:Asp-tRNA(Asn)/Glu-tRNA(Gln) amidotransferase subunit GatA [Streptomyces hygroscopicus subsp. hygroscopicus]|uniref:Glutamyl-tRNA(Gln) amidotransferase subunit A n=2 Tax=Streptomyces TaxID=1883 RepID=A0ABT9KZC7_9ACTN|nr:MULTISPECIES: Asp-tRNA(Asn)/Glu-tRNA(Gln) amidotransferase subunit GatA [Streptomyces]MBW8088732.1 Asp-tRNA(Asn)/Glu-tRNA(Gln) amidotransferase subunit GatA [Streptomyces hygroscopicus subsp. hygroscopicus]MCO8301762.1 Asp-tRNA(Asn)/Glu-tRNA(Gln) amidotransferase subunit GatA [Streptomyces sp. RKCA744]MDN3053874.1 Asp-tRNA(Asn)/Glu-tRNA(Gln) amidotransferase subunit GatA [Streptomyces sp. SRF1]MDP9613752.1 aspartyl-tRNA(Asn)/glutamyl-tRNA(Gln) amidotransferase subunit A [Streptomyces demaini